MISRALLLITTIYMMKNNNFDFKIKNPCPKNWDEMVGDSRKRFCSECQLHVHNLSTLTESETQKLIQNPGRLCVAYFQDSKGGVLKKSISSQSSQPWTS